MGSIPGLTHPPHLAARKGEMCKRKIKQYDVKTSIN